MSSSPEFTFPITLTGLPEEGKTYDLSADQTSREALSRRFSLPAVSSLTAQITVRPEGGGIFQVRGTVTGEAQRTCVVTLENLTEEVNEEIALRLLPPEKTEERETGEEFSPEAEDIEEIRDETCDLGELAAQYFALGLSSHPRKEGASLSYENQPAPENKGPFAELEKLKKEE